MNPALYINGQWQDGEGDAQLSPCDPSLGQVIARLQGASAQQINLAVTAARQALGPWRSFSGSQRAHFLQGFADELERRRSTLIELQMRNNGKPRRSR